MYLAAPLAGIENFVVFLFVGDEFIVGVDVVVFFFAGGLLGFVGAGADFHLGFEDAEFVALGSVFVADLAEYAGAVAVACPELWILVDDGADVAYGSVVVACLVKEYGAVVEGYHVVGVEGENVVEVFDGEVVFADLGAE